MAFGSLVLSAGFAAALVWQSARGTVVPWVVQVDKSRPGADRSRRPTADYRPTDPQIAWHLGRFIEQVRAIPADAIIVRQNWLRAYEWTTDRGAAALNDYARANDPFTKVGKQQVAVEVSSRHPRFAGQLPRRLDRAALRERPALRHGTMDRDPDHRDPAAARRRAARAPIRSASMSTPSTGRGR